MIGLMSKVPFHVPFSVAKIVIHMQGLHKTAPCKQLVLGRPFSTVGLDQDKTFQENDLPQSNSFFTILYAQTF